MTQTQFPLILGHRGSPRLKPENTAASFADALQNGADGIELDTQLTSDGFVVVMHDDTVNATTNGSGKVCDMPLSSFLALQTRQRNSHICIGSPPTLSETLDRFGAVARVINVEIKPSEDTRLAKATADIISAHPAQKQILCSSFDEQALRFLQQEYPQLRRALLFPNTAIQGLAAGVGRNTAWVNRAAQLGCEAVHPHWRLVNPRFIAYAHALDLRVTIWTVDSPAQAQAFAKWGADGVITNHPQLLSSLRNKNIQ